MTSIIKEFQVLFDCNPVFENQSSPRAVLLADHMKIKYLVSCLMMNALERSKEIKVTVSLVEKEQINFTSQDSYYDVDQDS